MSLAGRVCFLGLFPCLILGAGAAQDTQPSPSPTPPPQTTPTTSAGQANQTIQEIIAEGNRRIPKETILSRVYSRVGDIYDEAALQRDLRSVWNSGFFDDVRIEREQGDKGWIVHIYVREKPTIRTIEYHGLNAVSLSDVLDR